MPDIMLKLVSQEIKDKLHKEGLTYLDATVRGKSIVIFSEHEGKKENRCRFTEYKGTNILGMADHNNKWEDTPFEGTAHELLDIVIEQFPWILSDYNFN